MFTWPTCSLGGDCGCVDSQSKLPDTGRVSALISVSISSLAEWESLLSSIPSGKAWTDKRNDIFELFHTSPEERSGKHISLTLLTISGLFCDIVGLIVLLFLLPSCSMSCHQFNATISGTLHGFLLVIRQYPFLVVLN